MKAPSVDNIQTPGSARSRRLLFVAACGAAVLIIAGYVKVTMPRSGGGAAAPGTDSTSFITSVPEGAVLLFRNAAPGALYGRVALVPLASPDALRQITPISCERVHYAAGWGVCMLTDESRLPVRYSAFVFDRSFARHRTMALTGPPVRARVSPDGRRAALTVFERGHSYADESFSTKTIIVDTAGGRPAADLEAFAVEKDGRRFHAVDFNFWGVTFAPDGDRFFATLKTAGERYLVRGSVDEQTMSVIRRGVECPSLSPDGALIVFKKPLERQIGWHLNVLELASGTERPLNQVQPSVDDQVDWFDNRQVLYHESASEGTGIWVLPVDGITPPRLLLPHAYSPAVSRN